MLAALPLGEPPPNSACSLGEKRTVLILPSCYVAPFSFPQGDTRGDDRPT